MHRFRLTLPATAGLAASGLALLAASLILPADAAKRGAHFAGQYQLQLDLPGTVPDQTTLLNLTQGNAALDAGFTISDDIINEVFTVGQGDWTARRNQAKLHLWYKAGGNGTTFWRLTGNVTAGANGSFSGPGTLERFASPEAGTPDATYSVNLFAKRLDSGN
jgi:hypothetical protein